ncbi:conserved hypothetical protein [Vibrio crassostreae]|nr:conserved hypothetical protein [Vibrio chagasii]CAK2854520.1 conserved hypothetical protein [Vibrio crassostreae]
MKFYYLPTVNAEQTALELSSEPQVLTYHEKDKCWLHEDGTRFEISGAENVVPMSNDEEKYECLTGYFIVEVTDPKGVKGQFKLHARNEIVSCGIDALYPGADCDDEFEGQALKDSGIQRPDMDFEFLPHTICYGFNEGPVTDGTIELAPFVEGDLDYDPADEEEYHWKIV